MWTSHLVGLSATSFLLAGLTNAQSCNTPQNRTCWSPGFDVTTDYELAVPAIKTTPRQYTLNITETENWVGPDGQVKQQAMLINGQFPGPVIEADWGETIEVTVLNNLNSDGTSIHWHGLRQMNNSINDGANGATECPIPHGGSKTYTFQATQYGTSWYHSHFSVQYANGVTGMIQINGPASQNYDIDLGPLHISDWYLEAADTTIKRISNTSNPGAPPHSNNILFNGTNISPAGGQFFNVTLTPNATHRLRLINPSTENMFVVSLAHHKLTVIATDFVPVKPVDQDFVFVGIGQRYDVLINATEAVDNYWFNVTMTGAGCGSSDAISKAAIFRYDGAPIASPTDPGAGPSNTACVDSLVFEPIVKRNFTGNTSALIGGNELDIALASSTSTVFWNITGGGLDNSPMRVMWEKPLLQYVNEDFNMSFPSRENVLQLPDANVWTTWLIQNKSPVTHPMHLHGHDFLVLGAGAGTFTSANIANLHTDNPTRRDTTILVGNGWLVVAFLVDNPGAWLFHCHIAWHASQGLSVQFLERMQEIPGRMDLNAINPNCEAWNANPVFQFDSGL